MRLGDQNAFPVPVFHFNFERAPKIVDCYQRAIQKTCPGRGIDGNLDARAFRFAAAAAILAVIIAGITAVVIAGRAALGVVIAVMAAAVVAGIVIRS